ncbi:MAG: sigma-70 family RNA polymerase sigma factor [Planctomycetota bacterium]
MSPQTPEKFDAQIVAELTKCQASIELYVRGLLPGDPAFEEVVQQANARIWEKRATFELGTNFRAWAFAIARFEVLNYRKKQARDARLRFSVELTETIATEFSSMHDDLEDRQLALRNCLKVMAPESRELLMSRYGTKETLAEFASRIGRSAGGLKVALNRLRSSLGDCIERRLQAGGNSQ